MDIKSFQKKLGEVVELARINNRRLNGELLESLFAGDGLDADQMKSVHEYLKSQGIHILNGDEEMMDEEELKPIDFEEKKDADPLSPEEEEYLKAYMDGIDPGPVSEAERDLLFQDAGAGSIEAKQRLIELYLPQVVQIVRNMHRKEIFAGDMLQEGNIGLLSALEALETAENPHEWILRSVRNAVNQSIRMQQEQSWEDDLLINRVEKLESAVRDLTDGAEDKFSVEELSAFLDMSVEEIRDVLRLTGDDK